MSLPIKIESLTLKKERDMSIEKIRNAFFAKIKCIEETTYAIKVLDLHTHIFQFL